MVFICFLHYTVFIFFYNGGRFALLWNISTYFRANCKLHGNRGSWSPEPAAPPPPHKTLTHSDTIHEEKHRDTEGVRGGNANFQNPK